MCAHRLNDGEQDICELCDMRFVANGYIWCRSVQVITRETSDSLKCCDVCWEEIRTIKNNEADGRLVHAAEYFRHP